MKICLLSAAGGYISIDSITEDILPFLFLSISLESRDVPNEAPNVSSRAGVTLKQTICVIILRILVLKFRTDSYSTVRGPLEENTVWSSDIVETSA